MREIKFRAWDSHSKKMEYMKPYQSLYTISFIEYMQYTGLKDKNGKEIYEGDIVIAYDETMDVICKGQIIWDKCECGFCIKGAEPTFIGYYPELEVIGNIYENPELLEVQKNR